MGAREGEEGRAVHHILKSKRGLMVLGGQFCTRCKRVARWEKRLATHSVYEAAQFALNAWFLGQLKLELTWS